MPWNLALRIDLSSRRATVRLGTRLGQSARRGDLLVLSGDLGAGKTFLARSIARAFGVGRDQRVTSPTFTLVHQYPGRIPLVHADLYRVGDAFGLVELGLQELRTNGCVLIVEWGEPFVQELGGDALIIELQLAARGRTALLRPSGARSAEWLSDLAQLQAPVRNGRKPE